MNEHERKEFAQVMRNLDAEEQEISIKLFESEFLWKELKRRYDCSTKKLKQIREILNISEEDKE